MDLGEIESPTANVNSEVGTKHQAHEPKRPAREILVFIAGRF